MVYSKKNVFATIKFQHTLLIGKSNLERYLREYCAKFTSYAIVEENDEGADIVGYAKDNNEAEHLRADFKSCLYRKSGQVDILRNRVTAIARVVRKNKLSPQVALHRDVWQKMLEWLGMTKEEKALTADVKIKYEIPFKPTLDQLNNMIDEWDENHESKWDDIGFQLTGDSEIHWLSNSVAKAEYELDVKRDNDETVDTQSLLDALTERRDNILSLIKVRK